MALSAASALARAAARPAAELAQQPSSTARRAAPVSTPQGPYRSAGFGPRAGRSATVLRSPVVNRAATEAGNGATIDSAVAAKPVVKIDNKSDPFSTIVIVSFGDKLGDLLDTIAALKNLGLNIKRAKLSNPEEESQSRNKFYVTESSTGDKITYSQRLEEIRLTILNNMLAYHPEAAENLSVGYGRKYVPAARDVTHPLGADLNNTIETQIDISEDDAGRHSILRIITADRPGLLVDMVHILKDVSVNVISAEVDTNGTEADDTLLVSYHGEALSSSMQQLVKNALQYYLSLAEIAKDESY